MCVRAARGILILLAYALLPLYGVWILGGAVMDRWERVRRLHESGFALARRD